METRWLWTLLPVVAAVAACSWSPDTGLSTEPGAGPVTYPDTFTQTISEVLTPNPTAPGDPLRSRSSAERQAFQPATVRYQRAPREYFTTSETTVPGQVAFSSSDGSVQCEFRPMEDNPPLNMEPLGNWRLGFSQGACRWGDQNHPDYAVVDTRAEIRPGFAEQQDWINHVMPESYPALVPGTYIDLHTMGCFAEHAEEISCMKYKTGEAFAISSQGYRWLDESALTRSMDAGDQITQVLSSTPVFALTNGQKIACFREHPDRTQFFCQSLGPSLWGEEDNIVHFRLTDDHVEVIGSMAANPGLEVYLAQQPVVASKVLIHDGVTVQNNGTRLALRTSSGDAFWVSADEFGLGD